MDRWIRLKIELEYFAHATVAVQIQISFQCFSRKGWKFHQLLVEKQDPGHDLQYKSSWKSI